MEKRAKIAHNTLFIYSTFLNLVNPNQIWIIIQIFPIDLGRKEIPFGAKSKYGLI